MVTDPFGPEEKLIDLDDGPRQCCASHLGLCAAADASVYEPTTRVTGNLNALHTAADRKDWIGRIYKFRIQYNTFGSATVASMVRTEEHFALLIHVRLGGPPVQVFIPLYNSPHPGNFLIKIPRTSRRRIAETSYRFVKQIMWPLQQAQSTLLKVHISESFAHPIEGDQFEWTPCAPAAVDMVPKLSTFACHVDDVGIEIYPYRFPVSWRTDAKAGKALLKSTVKDPADLAFMDGADFAKKMDTRLREWMLRFSKAARSLGRFGRSARGAGGRGAGGWRRGDRVRPDR